MAASSYFPIGGKYGGDDIEAGNALYPGISATENDLRLGFIRKVFGLVSCQLALTAAVALFLVLNPPLQHAMASSLAIQLTLMLVSIAGLIPLYIYKDRHPLNLGLLALWTLVFSTTVGMACTFYAPIIVVQAVVITAATVTALTVYTFAATRRGQQFTWLGPILYTGLWTLIFWGLIQLIFRPGPLGQTVYSLVGALLFCGYIIFDVHVLATRLDVDDYIWGSVALYLDIINLFMYILRILGNNSNNN